MFAMLSPAMSPGDISGEFSGDVSDDFHFCYISTFFCYVVSGEVSGKVSGEPSLFIFFSERTVFCFSHLLPGVIFCYRRCFFATCKSNRQNG
jgi:hypothetical protein